MKSRRPVAISMGAMFVLVVLVAPLITAWIAQRTAPWPATVEAPDRPTIDINYIPSSGPGFPDLAEGNAPPGLELGIYLNDQLLAITQADRAGAFSIPLPVLPERGNRLTALPAVIDPSTLLLFYAPGGYQQDRNAVGRPARSQIHPPFLAFAGRREQNLFIYGSTEPRAEVEICTHPCQGNTARLATVSDDEGSFSGPLPLPADGAPASLELYGRIRFDASAPWIAFSAPLSPPPASQAQAAVIKRNLALTASPGESQLTFTVEMPTGYHVYQNLVSGGLSAFEFVNYLFGDIHLNTYFDPRKLIWRETKVPGAARARVIIQSEPLAYLIPQDTATTFQLDASEISPDLPPYTAEDEIILNLDATHLLQASLPPEESTAGQHTWRGALGEGLSNQLTLWISRAGEVGFSQLARLRLQNSLARLFERLPGVSPNPLLRKTLEGSLIGLLPASPPITAQAQIYDYYRDIYLQDPFIAPETGPSNLRNFVRELPGLLTGKYETLLFGLLWLIPSLLLLWSLAVEEPPPTASEGLPRLAIVGLGVAVFVALSLEWAPLLPAWFSQPAYHAWMVAANLTFILVTIFISGQLQRGADTLGQSLTGTLLLIALSVGITLGTGLFLFNLPDAWISTLLTGTQLLGLAGLAWLAVQIGARNPQRLSLSLFVIVLLLILGLSFPVQALPANTHLANHIGVLAQARSQVRPLLPLAIFLAIAFLLVRKFDRPISQILNPRARGLGRVIFVAFIVGFTPSWSFVPLSTLLSFLIFEWLLPSKPSLKPKLLKTFIQQHRKTAVDDLLRLSKALRLRRAVEGSLHKQLREGKLIPAEYREQQKSHEEQIARYIRPAYLNDFDKNVTVRDLAFNFGGGERYRQNVTEALSWGLLLLIPVLLISGIPLVISELNDFLPYPFLNIGVRLGLLALEYLASAFFLGFFFPFLRGRNGLEKGGWLAAGIIASLLPIHLLLLESSIELSALVIWGGSLLAYNLLIGLLAFDLKTLAVHGFQWDRLTDLYNLRDLTFYLTGSAAPLVTTILSAVGGNLNELIPAILKVVFPALTLEGPQAELLKLLLDLVGQIAGRIL
jgi:hypothetical protein